MFIPGLRDGSRSLVGWVKENIVVACYIMARKAHTYTHTHGVCRRSIGVEAVESKCTSSCTGTD